MSGKKRTLLKRITYAGAEAGSSAADMYWSVKDKFYLPWVILIVIGCFFTTFLTEWGFKTKVLKKRELTRSTLLKLSANHEEEKGINGSALVVPAQPPISTSRKVMSVIGQAGYLLSDNARNFPKYYFMLDVVYGRYFGGVSSKTFWISQGVVHGASQAFRGSNEEYETAIEIAEVIERRPVEAPFYAIIYYPLSGKAARTVFAWTGAGVHTIFDDLLPLLTLLPLEAIQWIQANPAATISFAVVGGVIALTAGVVTVIQTRLFEGNKSLEVLAKLQGEDAKHFNPPTGWIPSIKAGIVVLMPFFHGAVGASSLFTIAREAISTPEIKWPVAVISTVALGLVLAKYAYDTEVDESLKELDYQKILTGRAEISAMAHETDALIPAGSTPNPLAF